MAKLSEKTKARLKEERIVSFEEQCKKHLHNPVLKEGMASLFELFRELKMKPSWYYTGKYKCHYKKEPVVYFTVYSDNCFVRVATSSAEDNTKRVGINDYLRSLDDEMKTEFLSRIKQCDGCAEIGKPHSCAPGCDVEIDGVVRKGICQYTLLYSVDNPTTEQFEWIKKFIFARRKYIELNAV